MSRCRYESGEEISPGDLIRYHGEPGRVAFVVAELTGEPSLDWYLDKFPGGGVMIVTNTFGAVFLAIDDGYEDLDFVSRGDGPERQER